RLPAPDATPASRRDGGCAPAGPALATAAGRPAGRRLGASMLEGFATRRIDTGEASIHLAVGGAGPPVLLLHGYPQTHVCWHPVAPKLVRRFTVVCPDLRGYGESRRPPPQTPDHPAHSKRAMGRDPAAGVAAPRV